MKTCTYFTLSVVDWKLILEAAATLIPSSDGHNLQQTFKQDQKSV